VTTVVAFISPEETIRQVPVSALEMSSSYIHFGGQQKSAYLQCFEHVGKRCQSDQEMADNHGRREMSAIMERFLSDTLKIVIAGGRSFTSGGCESTHRFREAIEITVL
jgi:hypothetical protein